MACGDGRHLRALAKHGVKQLSGGDASAFLLDRANQLCREAQVDVELTLYDMRQGLVPGAFDVILNCFTSFGYFPSDEENAAVLSSVYRALRPQGRFALDFLNVELVSEIRGETRERSVGGCTVFEERHFDADSERINKSIRIVEPNGTERSYLESVRAYGRSELEGMLVSAGFGRVRSFGDFDGGSFRKGSERLILLAERVDASSA